MNDDVKIIRAAIETEIDGYRYFVEAAGKAAHERVKELWLGLAVDEIEHMKILQSSLTSLLTHDRWEPVPGEVDETLPPKAPIVGSKGPAPAGEFSSDVEAVEAGLAVEANTYDFYADAAKKTTSAEGRKTYLQLAKMEMGHYQSLEEAREMLVDPAQWQFRQVSPIQEG